MARIAAFIVVDDDQVEGMTDGQLEDGIRARLDEVFVAGEPVTMNLLGIDVEGDE